MAVYANNNHLLRLAQPLFWILDELSPELDSVARLDNLQSEARERLARFKAACFAAAQRTDAVEAIHYCFCAAMDQAGSRVHGRTGSCRGVWLQRSLLGELYAENDSGQHCRAWVARLQADPKSQAHALEVLGALIARGLTDNCGAPLPSVVAHVPHVGPAIPSAAEPTPSLTQPETSSQSRPQVAEGWKRYGPVLALIAAVLLLLAFMLYRQHVRSRALASRVDQLSASLTAQQESVDQRLARLLAPDIAAGTIGLGKKGDRVYLVFSGDTGFVAGKADITPQLARQLDQLAGAMAAVEGTVTIIGHTDASTSPRGKEASNLALSQARAMAVGRYLQERDVGHGRISIIGRGDTEPIGDNRTEAGRALNRRIEIVLDRTQGAVS